MRAIVVNRRYSYERLQHFSLTGTKAHVGLFYLKVSLKYDRIVRMNYKLLSTGTLRADLKQ